MSLKQVVTKRVQCMCPLFPNLTELCSDGAGLEDLEREKWRDSYGNII